MFWIITSLIGLVIVLFTSIVVIVKSRKNSEKKVSKIADEIYIQEGKIRKGGINLPPTIPKPKIVPNPQRRPRPQPQPRPKKPVVENKPSQNIIKQYFIQPWQSDKDKKWRFRIKHRNGHILASSVSYSSKQAMNDTIKPMSKAFDIEIREKLEIK